MSDDRWRSGETRYRDDWQNRDRVSGSGRYETDYDRDRRPGYGGSGRDTSSWRDDNGTTFGRGSRDYSAESYGRSSGNYGGDWGRNDWRDQDRYGYGRDRDQSYRPTYGAGSTSRDRGDLGNRSMSDLAFGRDGSGRDYSGRDYGRRDWAGDRNNERGFFERAGDEVASWFGNEDAERRRRQDARDDDPYGEHRGRGPKGYQRSDDRIRDDLNDRLTDDSRLDASEIDVAVSNREVTLTGTVGNRSDKRRAEDLAESISGVTHVQNNLRVQNASSGSSWTNDTSDTSSAFGTGTSRTGTAYETAGAGMASNRTTTTRTTKTV